MKKQIQQPRNRWLEYIGLAIIVIGAMLIAYFYFSSVDECKAEPFLYGAKQIEKSTGYEFQGWGILITPINMPSPQISFNSTAILIDGEPLS